ncbi:MAG: hypothetical protein J6A69_11880 [Clostridia bacterium]|nr:hypothetical protein [Clostridia bacterium]
MNNFQKYAKNPVFGNKSTGTVFDAYVWFDNGKYRMDFSWREKKACAVTFSDNGINWSEPVITLEKNLNSGWEDDINRNCVIKIDGIYKMWYTGQARGHSYIGYAESIDGLNFERKNDEPVLISEFPWEDASVMNPCVIYDNSQYKMWYSAGETYEPNVNAYATSDDGINWKKARCNPIFVCEKENEYEQNRIGGCQVLKTDDMGYVMFYIGYKNIDTSCICIAKSKDGITGWQRSVLNPIITPENERWDHNACYKPTVVWNEKDRKWMLWYNGRHGINEYIGYAEFDKRNLFE